MKYILLLFFIWIFLSQPPFKERALPTINEIVPRDRTLIDITNQKDKYLKDPNILLNL